jgi:hypothetical protein
MKDSDSQKLDSILTLLADMTDVFGKRFDRLEDRMATKEQVLALQTQVNSIEAELKNTHIETRLGDLEEKVFGEARR